MRFLVSSEIRFLGKAFPALMARVRLRSRVNRFMAMKRSFLAELHPAFTALILLNIFVNFLVQLEVLFTSYLFSTLLAFI